jgi:nucleotide-binding universal stress UspA family protein
MSASLRNILLATDDSQDAEVALQAAAEISEKSGAALHVVHVWTAAMPQAYPALHFDNYSRVLEEQGSKILRQQAWKARAAGGRAAWRYLREGEPVEEIVDLAEELDSDLVVVGSRGAG